MRIILHTSIYGSYHKYFLKLFIEAFKEQITGVILWNPQSKISKKQKLVKLIKTKSLGYMYNFLANLLARRKYFQTIDKCCEVYFSKKINNWKIPIHIKAIETFNVNNNIKEIRELGPDIIMVFGAPILKQEIIDIPRTGMINIHNGIIPNYKGVNSIEWAIINDDYNKVGVTVHYLIKQLDSGNILKQKYIDDVREKSIGQLYCESFELGIQGAIEVLSAIQQGIADTGTTVRGGSTFKAEQFDRHAIRKLLTKTKL